MYKYLLVFSLLLLVPAATHAQSETSAAAHAGPDADAIKAANDPMSSFKTINLHNYFVSSIHGAPDYSGNQLMFRYAQPIGRFILRATMPISMTSAPDAKPKTGLGDLNIFGIYVINKKGNKIGFGPQITMPTGTNDQGSGKWQAGVSVMAFLARSPIIQGGALLQWQMDFAGKSDKPHIQQLTAQIFGILQIGAGFYMRSTGIWQFDLEGGNYNIPIGLGVGKVVKVGKVVLNIFAEPQYSVVAGGVGQPRFQTFMGVNTQF